MRASRTAILDFHLEERLPVPQRIAVFPGDCLQEVFVVRLGLDFELQLLQDVFCDPLGGGRAHFRCEVQAASEKSFDQHQLGIGESGDRVGGQLRALLQIEERFRGFRLLLVDDDGTGHEIAEPFALLV